VTISHPTVSTFITLTDNMISTDIVSVTDHSLLAVIADVADHTPLAVISNVIAHGHETASVILDLTSLGFDSYPEYQRLG
jgi:hypothetical protein